ncbi:kinesin-like protein KIF16B isoform X2 [Genypterus blacodes]|uniref:kinesin-like protein KIF16B isoform X2 n=1 Tax=Genypterus blacodes TaxID=154954 RepID=UPI003F76EC94
MGSVSLYVFRYRYRYLNEVGVWLDWTEQPSAGCAMASVRVAVRVRPMDRREKDLTAKCIIKMEGTKTAITNLKIPDGVTGDSVRERTKTFTYDFSYNSTDSKSSGFVSQEKVFKDLGSDVLKAAFEGYNACIFAYGQTGSGKSYTMMGNPGEAGLIPRICEGLFSQVAAATRWDEASFRTEVSYLEIYNERVRDLLRRKSTQNYNLRVREHPKDGPYVEDLSKHLVQNYSDVEELMEAGNINRTTASTGMNDVSSRSHAIFTINFTQAKFDAEMPSETLSKIHLVDLAGSERADATGATGVRLKEGGNINKSLVTLGNVISSLADMTQDGVNTNLKKKSVFVPYRDSVLTWLLKDSLGGNSKTIMIATISPADVNYGETLSTLRYANRAKNIINKPTINEDTNVKLIRELRAEIARLKALLVQGNQIALLDSPTALSMEEKLHQNEARVLELTKEWTNKWNETQNILKEETLALRKEGIGVVLDSELPHLIGIDDDLLSTGIILYHLKEGRTYVGREDARTEQDIILHGLDLESEHCMFENGNGTVTIVPIGGAQCSVNGVQVTERSQLNQGAVILLGRTNMFRFNHPTEAAKLREKRKSGLLSSFSMSMTNLSKSCENLSAIMLYNPGLEFERQQREELEKLELKRRLIKEMEVRQQTEKAELELLQQEVENQRKESEEVQQQILRQEESLRCRSQDIEGRLRDFLAEKERFEEERRCEIQEIDPQPKQQQEPETEDVRYAEQRRQQEAAEQTEIYRELERLKREHEEQAVRLQTDRRRLEEQEQEQLSLVVRLEEQLKEQHEATTTLLSHEDVCRLEEERRALAEIREVLLHAKEAGEQPDVEAASKKARSAQARYTDFKETQVKELCQLEEGLQQQRELLVKEVAAEHATLVHLAHNHKERQQHLKEMQQKGAQDATAVCQEEQLVKQAEHRLLYKERRLSSLADSVLPALAEEKQRAVEVLERSGGGCNGNCDSPLGLDNTLYQVEKELEEKEEKLNLHWHSAQQLQQLQETYEFTANVARQEEKVRMKEKEILESKDKQQKGAMEQAVARLERRQSALRRSISLEPDTEDQRAKSVVLGGLKAGTELDQQRVEREIQRLRRKITQGEANTRTPGSNDERSGHTSSPVSHIQSLTTLLPISDDRINAYIEEEVQRRLHKLNLLNGSSNMEPSLSSESFKEEEMNGCSSVRLTDEDGAKLQKNVNPRRFKYERPSGLSPNFMHQNSSPNTLECTSEGAENILLKLESAAVTFQKDKVINRGLRINKWLQQGLHVHHREVGQPRSKPDSCGFGCECFGITSSTTKSNFDGDENITFKKKTSSISCVHSDDEVDLQCTNEKRELLVIRCSKEEVKYQACDVRKVCVSGHAKSKENLKESVNPQLNHEMDATKQQVEDKRSYNLWYFAGKLSEAYRDAGRRLQNTRDIIRNVQAVDMKIGLFQYVTMISKELPFVHQMQSHALPDKSLRENKLNLVDLSRAGYSTLLLNGSVSGLPKGSVFSHKTTNPSFWQKLVQLPPALSELESLPSQKMMETVKSLLPEMHMSKIHCVFWLKAANCKQPIPQPACLLLLEKDIIVVSTKAASDDTLAVLHHLNFLEVKEIQIGLAGQHVRFIGCTEDTILAVFTHSKELSQELCKTLLKDLAPQRFSEDSEAPPLLKEDLMVLSLDWAASVTDVILDTGLHLTSRFKRVLADLLYIVHGNMGGPDRPSLADICPLLYTSVKVKNCSHMQKDAIYQFLLTDTHVVLLQEDGVFHPVPRNSSLVPVQPQFQGLNLRRRPDIRRVLVRESDNCMVVDIMFMDHQSRAGRKNMESSQGLGEMPSIADSDHQCDSWKLVFSCTSEALILIHHLCT